MLLPVLPQAPKLYISAVIKQTAEEVEQVLAAGRQFLILVSVAVCGSLKLKDQIYFYVLCISSAASETALEDVFSCIPSFFDSHSLSQISQ